MSRYQLAGGKYDPELYPVARGKDRYPHSPPHRLIVDYNAAMMGNNSRLERLKRRRNWHDDRRQFRQEYAVPEEGLSPTKLEKWYEWLYHERCGGDANSYSNLLKQIDKDIDELIGKYKLARIPFIRARLENYLLLNVRYCNHRWNSFTGYYTINARGVFETLFLTPYIKLTSQVKDLLVDWLKNGVPETIPCSLEVKDHPLGKAWRLCCHFPTS